MTQGVQVAVIGAGICGLATAVACRAAGATVTVYESAPSLAPLGTAISLWPNALTCLASWGLEEAIERIGHPFDRIATRHPDGRMIFDVGLSDLHAKHARHSRCVTRADLHSTLAAALPDKAIQLGKAVKDVREDRGATLTLHDGTGINADLIVVADGQNSPLRDQIIGPTKLRPAGYGAVLGLSSMWSTPPGWVHVDEACEYYGPNGRFGVFRLGDGQTYWFFVSSAVSSSTRAIPADPAWVLNQLRDWPAFMGDLVRTTPRERMPQVAFHDRAPAPHWGKGRILIAGDAAHPMIPNFGQGANQAIEDGHAIGLGLAAGLSGPALAVDYTRRRKARAERIVAQSRQNGQLTQAETPLRQMIRNTVMRMVPKRAVLSQLDWQFTLPDR